MSHFMQIKTTLFASLREAAGAEEVTIALPTGATVQDVWPRLVERYPAIAGLGSSVAWAVNHAYVSPDHPLNDGDSVAALPPISGGIEIRILF